MAISVSIAEVGARGDGIATHEGNKYFVPFALAGETVEIEPGVRRGEGTAAILLKIVTPSPERQTPPCPHFTVCGGCALQHWLGEPYAAWKSGLIARALSQSGVTAPAFEPGLVGLPRERRRADFVLRRQGKRVLAGFHERGSHHVVDVESCPVITPRLEALLGSLRTTGFVSSPTEAPPMRWSTTPRAASICCCGRMPGPSPRSLRARLWWPWPIPSDLARLSWGG